MKNARIASHILGSGMFSFFFFDTDTTEIAKYIDTSNTFQGKNTIFTKYLVRDINSRQAHTPRGGGHRALETIGKYNVF